MKRRQFLAAAAAAGVGTWACGSVRAQPGARVGDVIVLIPGIMGSVLRKDDRDVWAFSRGAILDWLKTGGNSIKQLTLSGDSPEVDDIGDGVSASRIFPDVHLFPGFWKIDGYTKTSKALQTAFSLKEGDNYFEFAYDWRRDNRVAARKLARSSYDWLKNWRAKSGNADAKLVIIAHSMGGLVARNFAEALEGWRDTRRIITLGTPYRGSVNALDVLSNGFRVGSYDLSTMIRSWTSVYRRALSGATHASPGS